MITANESDDEYYHVELKVDFSADTTNDKNNRGRKVCPITYAELSTDNTIQLGNTLFSTKGVLQLLKHTNWYHLLTDYPYFNADLLMHIKHPLTNVFFTKKEAWAICALILKKYPRFTTNV